MDMNQSYASRLKSATKSLLVLTAPNVIEDINDGKEIELKTEDQNQIDDDDFEDVL